MNTLRDAYRAAVRLPPPETGRRRRAVHAAAESRGGLAPHLGWRDPGEHVHLPRRGCCLMAFVRTK